MKKLLLILLCLPFIGFGQQISLKDLISISNMDSESFEIYSMNKSYKFGELLEDENIEGIRMDSYKNQITRYLTWFSKYFATKKTSGYQSDLQSELIGIYDELKSLNFSIAERRQEGKFYYKKYEKSDKKKTVEIFIKKSMFEIAYTEY
jgi:hypothetical protein